MESKSFEKRNKIFEHNTIIVDNSTGEITNTTTESISIQDKEPNYIKLYLDCICTFKGLTKALTPILISMCKYMTWADEKQIIIMNKYIKENIAKENNVTIKRVNQALTDIIKSDIFKKIEGCRGVYEVNPFIIAKGKWADIKKLRGKFDFIEGTIEIEEEVACESTKE